MKTWFAKRGSGRDGPGHPAFGSCRRTPGETARLHPPHLDRADVLAGRAGHRSPPERQGTRPAHSRDAGPDVGRPLGPPRRHRAGARHPAHRGGSGPTRAAATRRLQRRRRTSLVHRTGAAGGSRGGDTPVPAARRPRRLHAHLRFRVPPLGRPRPRDKAPSRQRPAPRHAGTCSGFRDRASSLLSDGSMSGLRQNTAHPGPLADRRTRSVARAARPSRDRHAQGTPDRRLGRTTGISGSTRCSATALGSRRTRSRHPRVPDARPGGPGDGDAASVTASPRVLPYVECPGAAPNASWMAGTDLRAMRTEVLERLRATDCCTHLNDGLRSLAEVPVLAASLPA